ncbi:MAG TPA: hypothetical protein VNA89_14805 [Gemmatimonadaceae bacterium]|nr:hypothetical protein [Gemmatimonadaceae bacterium]
MRSATCLARGIRRALLAGPAGGCLAICLASCLAACTPVSPGVPGVFGGGARVDGSARDDRVILGSLAYVAGLAVSRRYVFAVGDGTVAAYDRQLERWLPPAAGPALRADEPVGAVAADPSEDALWIGVPGAVLTFRPFSGELTRTLVAGNVDRIIFDAGDPGRGAFVRAGGAWTRVTPTGLVTPALPAELPRADSAIASPTLEELYRQFPGLRSSAALLTRGDGVRSWPVTAGARAPERDVVYLGTYGNGIFEVDPVFGESTRLPFGLLEPGAGALALASDGVWVASGAGGAVLASRVRGGLTFVGDDLQQWRWVAGDELGRLLSGSRALDLAVRDGTAWIATDRGLVQTSVEVSDEVRYWGRLRGLPADRVTTLVVRDYGVWAGTARGLALVSPDFQVARTVLPGLSVRALLADGDSLWVGTESGLFVLPRASEAAADEEGLTAADADPAIPPLGRPAFMRARALEGESRLRTPIHALAGADGMLYVATAEGVLVLGEAGPPVLPRLSAVDFGRVGGVTTLAVDAGTLWVGGRRGLLVVDRDSETSRLLAVGTDLPGEVTDVALAPGLAWVATSEGVVRFRRLADGSVR